MSRAAENRRIALARWLALVASVALAAPAGAQPNATPWVAPLRAARVAYAAGRFEPARALFARADAAIGEERWDDEGRSLMTPAQRAARASMRCPWGLSALAVLRADDREQALAIDEAISRVTVGCAPAEQAVAADLLGSPLAAALRLEEAGLEAFPAPFASRTLSAEARAFARAHTERSFPAARDLDEAQRFVLADMIARHGPAAQCGAPRGIRWTRPGQTLPLPDWDEEDEPPPPPAPFSGQAPDALALLRCEHPPPLPPEEQGFGDGAFGVEYLLRREASGAVTVLASFPGFPSLDCWTGVVQGERGSYPIALPCRSRTGCGHLYAFEREEGYRGFGDDEASFVVRTVTLCDPSRGACRSLPIAIERVELVERGDDWTARRSSWRARPIVARGRLRLSNVRGAPALLRRFGGGGVSLDELFASPSTSSAERDLYPPPEARPSPSPRASRDCPWQVADPDGQTNVRAEPSTRRPPVGTVPSGTTVAVAERRGRWWRIEAPTAGWLWAPNLRQVCDGNVR